VASGKCEVCGQATRPHADRRSLDKRKISQSLEKTQDLPTQHRYRLRKQVVESVFGQGQVFNQTLLLHLGVTG
jgi:hypothetical protein